ncbi:MAG: hypothetical protein PHY94_04035 [Candidatus Omnitrophica bacterium]|nr:hypothetical protein [Candidatus Omnitrophota bacterium]
MPKARKWIQPKLTILFKDDSQERILASCKVCGISNAVLGVTSCGSKVPVPTDPPVCWLGCKLTSPS